MHACMYIYIFVYAYIYIFAYACIYIYIYILSPDRSSVRSDVASDKINFRPDIRQNFFFLKKMRTSKVCVALKTICSSCTLTNIKLR